MTDPKTSALQHTSLSTEAARNLSTTTKSAPQMQGISPRWLLKMLPWVNTPGGVYRVNRRLSYDIGEGHLRFIQSGAEVKVSPRDLGELPLLRGFDNLDVLISLSGRLVQQELAPGDTLSISGQHVDRMFIIAYGKVGKVGVGKYGEDTDLGVISEGGVLGDLAIVEPNSSWKFTAKALTPCTVLSLSRQTFEAALEQSESLRLHLQNLKERVKKPQDKHGQALIQISSGHTGETELPRTFVDYELSPREYELSIAQTVLQIHTRVADLYNQPMNQIEQQLRLTVEALREQQEYELINNRSFGLLHNADSRQRINTKSGPPTPDDLDDILCRRRGTRFFLAHPKAIAAFGRECNRRGIYPATTEVHGKITQSWRGVPILPCDKIPITEQGTSSILVMRTGEDDQGVIGLHQTGIPDEIEPSLSARFMGINEKAILSYLVTAYFSAAVLVPDALGILEQVEIGHR